MNWFKKKFNRFFYENIEEEIVENIDEIEMDEPITEENSKSSRRSFRFPIIADDEIEQIKTDYQNNYSNQITDYYQSEKKHSPVVYDVEVSGIRELLEQRANNKGKVVRRYSSNRKDVVVDKPKSLVETVKKNKPQPAKVEEAAVVRKKFVPTQVPSPIHGFKKPSTINELLNKKTMHQSNTTVEQENLNSIQSITTKEVILATEEIASTQVNTSVKVQNIYQNNPADNILIHSVEKNATEDHDVSNLEVVNDNGMDGKLHDGSISLSIYDKLDKNPTTYELQTQLAEANEQQYEGDFQELGNHGIHVVEVVQQAEVIEKIAIEDKLSLEEDYQFEDVTQLVEELANELENQEDNESLIEAVPEVEDETAYEGKAEIEYDLEYDVITEIEDELKDEDTTDYKNELEFKDDIQVQEKPYTEVETYIEEASIIQDEAQAEGKSELEEEIEVENEFDLEEEHEPDQDNMISTINSGLHEHNQVQLLASKLIDEQTGVDRDSNHSLVNEDNDEKQNIHIQSVQDNKMNEGSKLPFNVLMLKSDIEKLKLKSNTVNLNTETRHTMINENQSSVMNSDVNDSQSESLDVQTSKQNNNDHSLQSTNENSSEQSSDESSQLFNYEKPAISYLVPPEEKTEDLEWMESQGQVLVEALSHFQVTAQIESIMQGPAVTQFEITVGHGTKVSKIRNLADDLKLALAAKDIRIQAPIPGKSSIGIEIPNRVSRAVRLSEVIRSDSFIDSSSPLEAALGLDLTGKPITIDLCKMPHGLIAGATGSGKSVCINSILVSLLYKADPHELKLMLIDPKVVELAPFNNIPHLVSPVITDVKTATAALKWAVEEMERRYQLFAHVGVRDITRYNKQAKNKGNKNILPYILIVIDELADLMMMAPSDVEESIARIAQKARACGIHLIVATQRPSVDVITGLIKSNIPTRIAFAVSSQIDSRTILDSQGAERLLGRGDMLYLGNGMSNPIRIQGTFVTDDEIEEIIDHVRSQGKPSYMFEHEELLKKSEMVEEYDELFEEVCRFVFEQGTASTSSIQRNYHIGYNRAARLMDLLEKNGYISEQRGSKAREVYITESDLNSMFD
nr:DNA translocase FtsK [Lysinibacillus timonensis]